MLQTEVINYRVSSDLENQEMSGNFLCVKGIKKNVRESAKILHVREFYFSSDFCVRDTSRKLKNMDFFLLKIESNFRKMKLILKFLPEFPLMYLNFKNEEKDHI